MNMISNDSDKIKMLSRQLDANIIGKLTYLPERMKMNVSNKDGAVVVNTGIPCDMFNVVCLTDWGVDLPKITNYFSSANLPFAWWIGFGDDCGKYKQKLEEVCVKSSENETGMYVDISKIRRIPDCEICRILQVVDLDPLKDFVAVYKKLIPSDATVIEQFYLSAFHFIIEENSLIRLFVGYVDQQPVAIGVLFLYADVAGVWDVVTLPGFRNMGIATSIVRHMLFYANDKYGYRTGVLTATKSGENVYQKIGFQKVKEFSIFNVSSETNSLKPEI